MLVLIPSRGRPAQLKRAILACWDTHTAARIIVRVDADDPMLPDYRDWDMPVICGPRVRPAAAMAEAFSKWPGEDAYLLMNDDAIPRTDWWDSILAETAGQWGISYPDDGIHGRRKATFPCVGGDLLRAIGWWALPSLTHLYVDAVFDFLGRQLGCLRYRPDVLIEHMHWSVGKSERDETYQRVDNGEDQKCFQKWMYAPGTLRLIERLHRSIAK